MKAAYQELPEDAKEAAAKTDESFLPDNFIMTRVTLPVVGMRREKECYESDESNFMVPSYLRDMVMGRGCRGAGC